jgi:hypothetical protein
VPLSTLSADTLLDSWGTNEAKFASLHTAYSATGSNEVTGGSPAYARQSVTWSSAAGNSKALSGTPYSFNVPGSATVEFIGFWDAATSGNFAGMFPAGNAAAFAFSAPSSTSTLLAPGSSYASNQQVVVFVTGGAALPTGLTAGTIYWTHSPSSDSFQLSATSGGSAISLSSDGSGIIQAITPEAFGSQGTFSLSSATMSLV